MTDTHSINAGGAMKSGDEFCCFGKIQLRCGVMMFAVLTLAISICFIIFAGSVLSSIPWWVWAGNMTGIAGGIAGLVAVCCNLSSLAFIFELWAIFQALWWGIFIVIYSFELNSSYDSDEFMSVMWASGFFLWSVFIIYTLNRYYNLIRPPNSSWCLCCSKPQYGKTQKKLLTSS